MKLTAQKRNADRVVDALGFLHRLGVPNVELRFYRPLPYTERAGAVGRQRGRGLRPAQLGEVDSRGARSPGADGSGRSDPGAAGRLPGFVVVLVRRDPGRREPGAIRRAPAAEQPPCLRSGSRPIQWTSAARCASPGGPLPGRRGHPRHHRVSRAQPGQRTRRRVRLRPPAPGRAPIGEAAPALPHVPRRRAAQPAGGPRAGRPARRRNEFSLRLDREDEPRRRDATLEHGGRAVAGRRPPSGSSAAAVMGLQPLLRARRVNLRVLTDSGPHHSPAAPQLNARRTQLGLPGPWTHRHRGRPVVLRGGRSPAHPDARSPHLRPP